MSVAFWFIYERLDLLGDVPSRRQMTEIEIFFGFVLLWAVVGLIWLRRREGKIKPPEN